MCITHIFTSTLGIGLGIPCILFGMIMLISFLMCEFLEKYFTNVCLFWRPFRRRARAMLPGNITSNNSGHVHPKKSSSSSAKHIEYETRQRISSNVSAVKFSSLVDVTETSRQNTASTNPLLDPKIVLPKYFQEYSDQIVELKQFINESDPPPPYEKCFPKPLRRYT